MYIALLLNRQSHESEATSTCPYLFEALTVLHTKVVLSYVCYAEFDPLRFADWAIGRSPLCPQLVRVSRHQGHLISAVLSWAGNLRSCCSGSIAKQWAAQAQCRCPCAAPPRSRPRRHSPPLSFERILAGRRATRATHSSERRAPCGEVMRERRLAAGRERSRAQHLPSGCAAKIWPSFGSKTVIELAPHICERNSFSDRIIKAVEATSAVPAKLRPSIALSKALWDF